jgi:hypothetical protein
MYNSRSCDLEKFLGYVKAKLFRESDVAKLYSTPRLRNDAFTRYCLEKSSEDRMLNRLENFINNKKEPEERSRKKKRRKGNKEEAPSKKSQKNIAKCHDEIVKKNVELVHFQNVNIYYGNWGRNPNMKNQAPTPGIGLRRKIDKRFSTTTVCEKFTSKTCPRCKQRSLENPILNGIAKKKHHLLRCKHCSSWWNRNVVGAYNILLKGLEQRAATEPANGQKITSVSPTSNSDGPVTQGVTIVVQGV